MQEKARAHIQQLIDSGHEEYRLFDALDAADIPAEERLAARRSLARVLGQNHTRGLDQGKAVRAAGETLLAAHKDHLAWAMDQWERCLLAAAPDKAAMARMCRDFPSLLCPSCALCPEAFSELLRVLVTNHRARAFDIVPALHRFLARRTSDTEEAVRFFTIYADIFEIRNLDLFLPLFEELFSGNPPESRREFLAVFSYDTLVNTKDAEKAILGMAKTYGQMPGEVRAAFVTLALTVARQSLSSAAHVCGGARLDKTVAGMKTEWRAVWLSRFKEIVAFAGTVKVGHCLGDMARRYASDPDKADACYAVAEELAREFGSRAADTWLDSAWK